MSTHQCPVTGCDEQIPRHLLACPAHWRLVPRPLQKEIYATWKNGHPTGRYFNAQRDAISIMNGEASIAKIAPTATAVEEAILESGIEIVED